MNARHLSVLLLATMIIVVLAVGGSASGKEADTTLITVDTCTGETTELSGYEKRMLDLHNQTRSDHGLQPLCVNPALTQAARAHSQEMLDEDYFGHDSFDGESFEARLGDFGYAPDGYSYWAYGENIAWGQGNKALPDDRFEEWMGSAEHRDNILNGDFSGIGVGARPGETYDAGTMYTADFGTRR